MFNKNIYWNTKDIGGLANKWSWICNIVLKDENSKVDIKEAKTDEEKKKVEKAEKIQGKLNDMSKVLSNFIYSIGSMPVKKMNVVNTFQGGIRMTHPGRVYYDGDLELEFYEDTTFSVTKVFYTLLNSRFSNITIMDEDYPYKDSTTEIDYIVIHFYDASNVGIETKYTFYEPWVKQFEYLNNLETKNEEEQLKCKATIKYNYYTIE